MCGLTLSGLTSHVCVCVLQGKKSTLDERGVAAKKTVELDDSLGGAAKQVCRQNVSDPTFGYFVLIFRKQRSI